MLIELAKWIYPEPELPKFPPDPTLVLPKEADWQAFKAATNIYYHDVRQWELRCHRIVEERLIQQIELGLKRQAFIAYFSLGLVWAAVVLNLLVVYK